jgi:hypothetical protein
MALSLYELFIDTDVKVASRLQIYTCDDLKINLVSVVIAVMAVTFLGQIMSRDGETQLLGIGVAVALVIAALNLFLWIVKGARSSVGACGETSERWRMIASMRGYETTGPHAAMSGSGRPGPRIPGTKRRLDEAKQPVAPR